MWKQATRKVPIRAITSPWRNGNIGFGFSQATQTTADFPPDTFGQRHPPSSSALDCAMAQPVSNHYSQQLRFFQATTFWNDVSSTQKSTKTVKKGQKHSSASKRAPPAHKMAAGIGMSLEECSDYLVKECSEIRHMELNKRQRLKPWIMALLVHRYDRGIRDIDELNTDSIYYNGGNNSDTISFIDLRKVLTPESFETDNYIAANGSEDREQIREILRHEKLSLLATEARRIIVDREIPLLTMADLKNEAGVRKLSKQNPSVFLSLFSRAFCVSERNKPKRNYTHRRFHPPSLKSAAYKRKKLQEKRNRELASKKEGKSFHRNAPKALQEKLRIMSERNRIHKS